MPPTPHDRVGQRPGTGMVTAKRRPHPDCWRRWKFPTPHDFVHETEFVRHRFTDLEGYNGFLPIAVFTRLKNSDIHFQSNNNRSMGRRRMTPAERCPADR